MLEILDRLGDGRSFWRTPHHPSGLADAIRIRPPPDCGEGYEDAYASSPEFVITTKHIEARRTFCDDEPGLGRLVFIFHLQGRRTIELNGSERHELTSPVFAVYYQAEGVSKRSIWNEGDIETSVLVGFWPSNPPAVLRRSFEAATDWCSIFAARNRSAVWFQRPLPIEMERAARTILMPNVHPAVITDFLITKANELLCLGSSAILSSFGLAKAASSGLQARLCRVQRLIDADLRHIPFVAELARAVKLTPSTLSAEFHRAYGMTIPEYVAQARMRHAQHLLTSTTMPLKKIAHEVGYSHTSNFCLAFKREFGMTPRQTRKSADPFADELSGS